MPSESPPLLPLLLRLQNHNQTPTFTPTFTPESFISPATSRCRRDSGHRRPSSDATHPPPYTHTTQESREPPCAAARPEKREQRETKKGQTTTGVTGTDGVAVSLFRHQTRAEMRYYREWGDGFRGGGVVVPAVKYDDNS
ncbi:hypothetical protein Hdeb2414_s0002g00065101 [Helianthus debilis subsp. tardiflorus]